MSSIEERNKRKDSANEVESFLDDFSAGIAADIVEENTMSFDEADSEELKKAREIKEGDIEHKQFVAKADAKGLVDAMLDVYAKNTSDINYIQLKAKMSTGILAKILFQIEVTEEAINSVMEQIRYGEVNPNFYKNLSDLHKDEREWFQQMNLYLTNLETSNEKTSQDVEMNNAIEIEDDEQTSTAKVKDNKQLQDMLEQFANRIKSENNKS